MVPSPRHHDQREPTARATRPERAVSGAESGEVGGSPRSVDNACAAILRRPSVARSQVKASPRKPDSRCCESSPLWTIRRKGDMPGRNPNVLCSEPTQPLGRRSEPLLEPRELAQYLRDMAGRSGMHLDPNDDLRFPISSKPDPVVPTRIVRMGRRKGVIEVYASRQLTGFAARDASSINPFQSVKP